jgi:hypothetical protein
VFKSMGVAEVGIVVSPVVGEEKYIGESASQE